MCYQLVELYSSCKCIYYQHAADKCASYGRPGHCVTKRTILVGYACQEHSRAIYDYGAPSWSAQSQSSQPRSTLKQAIKQIRETEHVKEPYTLEVSRSAAESGTINRNKGPKSMVSGIANGLSNISEAPEHTQSQDPVVDLEISDDDNSSTLTSLLGSGNRASSITSAQLSEPPNAIELLTSGLVYDKHLQHLWPQFILRSSSMAAAHQQISRLILRYSLDLQTLAADTKEDFAQKKKATKFIERKKRAIAREICVIFWLPDLDSEITKRDIPELDDNEKLLEDTNEVEISETAETPQIHVLKDFLFRTDPFYIFRENIRSFVEEPLHLPLQIRLFDSARQWYDSICSVITMPRITPGKQRLRSTCVSESLVRQRPSN